MKIIVSACLLGHECKYSGGSNLDERAVKLKEKHELIPVCPEVLGGLPVPRTPCEIVGGTVTDKNGVSRDREFREGAKKALDIALKNNADCAVLMPRSPSCGAGRIYDGSFTGKIIEGNGIFADLLIKNGIRVVDINEL